MRLKNIASLIAVASAFERIGQLGGSFNRRKSRVTKSKMTKKQIKRRMKNNRGHIARKKQRRYK